MADRTMANLRKISRVAAYAAVYSLNTYRARNSDEPSLFEAAVNILRNKLAESSEEDRETAL